jgi:hypothetical protein
MPWTLTMSTALCVMALAVPSTWSGGDGQSSGDPDQFPTASTSHPLPTVEQLLTGCLEAMGGEGQIESKSSGRIRLRLRLPFVAPANVEYRFLEPDHSLTIIDFPDGTRTITGSDDLGGWETRSGEEPRLIPEDADASDGWTEDPSWSLPGGRARSSTGPSGALPPLFSPHVQGLVMFDERPCWRIRAGMDDGTPISLFLDRDSGLLAAMHFRTPNPVFPAGPAHWYVRIKDYTNYDGILLPQRVTMPFADLELEAVEWAGLNYRDFEPPPTINRLREQLPGHFFRTLRRQWIRSGLPAWVILLLGGAAVAVLGFKAIRR